MNNTPEVRLNTKFEHNGYELSLFVHALNGEHTYSVLLCGGDYDVYQNLGRDLDCATASRVFTAVKVTLEQVIVPNATPVTTNKLHEIGKAAAHSDIQEYGMSWCQANLALLQWWEDSDWLAGYSWVLLAKNWWSFALTSA